MSFRRKPKPGDEECARRIVAAARGGLTLLDVNTALRDEYSRFIPPAKGGEEVHYTSHRYNRQEQRHVDYDHPDRSVQAHAGGHEGGGRDVQRPGGFDAGTTE